MPIRTKKKLQVKSFEPVYNRLIVGVMLLLVFIIILFTIGSQNNPQQESSNEASSSNVAPTPGSTIELRVESSDSLTSASTGTLLQGSSLGSELDKDSQNIQSSQSPQDLPAAPMLQGGNQAQQQSVTP